MIAQLLVLVLLPALLLASALCDLASYTIPNFLSAAIALLFLAFAAAAPLLPAALGMHVLAGAAGLVLGFGLFALGWIGGGDAKLFAAMALWLGFSDLLPFVAAASLFGGLLTLSLLLLRQVPLPAILAGQGWLARLHDVRSGIPYGVALAAGAFAVLPHAQIVRMVLKA
ncbi:MAG: prepilin peptidase [Alphaproteobacteria bacterium]|nr:prepilin peptidase [Alphaproteobacteria bacterium]